MHPCLEPRMLVYVLFQLKTHNMYYMRAGVQQRRALPARLEREERATAKKLKHE